jgi:TrmH family RNA methyltransferase
MELTSLRNPLLQRIRKAVAAGRQMEGGFVVAEGPHLIEEALSGTWPIVQVITTSAGRARYSDLLERTDAPVVEVAQRAFEAMTETQHSQQILALLERRCWSWTDLTATDALVVALDGIQDPGNAGTIMRSAEAFGATGLVFLKGSAHIANGKVLRASAGSAFRMPCLEGLSAPELLSRAETNRLAIYVLDAGAKTLVTEADLGIPLVLVAGNEGSGVCHELRSAGRAISIPTRRVESINAAVACSVALFAAQLQRNAT